MNQVTAKITRISVQAGESGNRFVLSLQSGTEAHPVFEYFSIPLSSKDSVRIGKQQLADAIPSLLGMPDPLTEMLVKRTAYIGTEVVYVTVPQVDKETGRPKVNARTGVPFVNVRLMASNKDLTPEQAAALLRGAGEETDEIPM